MGLVRTSLIHGGPTSPSEGFWGSNSRGLVSTQTHAAVSVCFIVSITHLDRDIIKCWSTSETLHQTGCSSDLNLSRRSHLFTWSCVSSTCYQATTHFPTVEMLLNHIKGSESPQSARWKRNQPAAWSPLEQLHDVLATYRSCVRGKPLHVSLSLQAVASRTRNRILVHKKACSNPPRMRQTAQILKG